MNSRAAARTPDALQQGREAFRTRAWGAAFSQLSAADAESSLDPQDLVLLAQSALLTGRDTQGAELLARANQAFANCGDAQRAARCAFWLGFTSLLNGEFAKGGGWLSRAVRLLDGQPESVENGYLLLPEGYRCFTAGDAVNAHAAFLQAAIIGERFGDRDLCTLALQGQGRSLIRQGEISRGVALLDEAMIAVTGGEVSPLSAGGVYCSVLDACGEILDVQRAQEWTSALEKWCAHQPDLVPYRGQCLVRRAELLRIHGAWDEALEWAKRGAEWLSRHPHKRDLGEAFYQMGEILRCRGRFADSEEAYRQAGQWYSGAGLGLARLRLAQGRVDAANIAIRGMAEEVREPAPRAGVLDAYVEIAIAANDVAAARVAAAELAEIAARRQMPFFSALSFRSTGAVLLAEGNAREAIAELRRSYGLWSDLEAPYEASRVRFQIAQACRALGDDEACLRELTEARIAFRQLGAVSELSRVETLLAKCEGAPASPLTAREIQVLKLVASGLTNRAIAARLEISEKTVARHLSNIFTKLDLSSRTAATAYAYDHDLV